ncbi:PR/SET domain 13 [Arctopsyche grandis]|uniref:PR/SET domain 13 n=1 Tax=Arctopsyche grandis TaxID=121162 RepID=UPI00406D82BA
MSSEMVEKLLEKRNSSSKLNWKKAAKVKTSTMAVEQLARGVRTLSFDVEDLPVQDDDIDRNLLARIDNKGFLKLGTSEDKSSFKRINLAPDIHSTNIKLEIAQNTINSTKLYLEITKDVEKGKELLLWFSEDVLAIVNMPFLTPINITGHKKYRCHKCEEAFEYPNPLKIHLLLSCQVQPIYILWQHISMSINSTRRSENLNTLNPYTRSVSEPPSSAFSPYRKREIEVTNVNLLPLNLTVGTSMQQLNPHQQWMNNMLEFKTSGSLDEISSNYAADVELFASNWGKLKQGHMCVYCGKIYSRKYGLKIHIRTHTGYKPLKCKFCLRPFGDPSNLNKHVRLHASGLTPYMCSLCGKVLVRRRDLERHLKSQHLNEDGCSMVDVKEANSDYLNAKKTSPYVRAGYPR